MSNLAGYVMAVAAAAAAQAQNVSWNNVHGGSWNQPENWAPADVPDTAAEHAQIDISGTYVVTLDSGVTVGGLALSNAGAILNIVAGQVLGTRADIVNDHTIVVNSGAQLAGAAVEFQTDARLRGSGTLMLNAASSKLDTAALRAAKGAVIRHDAGHTVRGSGVISGRFVNDGLVVADVPAAAMSIRGNVTNNGTFSATNGATLYILDQPMWQSPVGRLRADGGTIVLSLASISGGIIEAMPGSVVRVDLATSTLTNVTLSGSMQIASAQAVLVRGAGLTNNGSILVNDTASGIFTAVQFDVNGTLGGTGSLVLNASLGNLDSAVLRASGAGAGILNAASHSIRGRGRIVPPFDNAGTLSPGVTNDGIGIIDISGRWTTRASGRLDIDIGGTAPGGSHDLLTSQGPVTLGGTLNVSLINGFVPLPGSTFDVLTAPDIGGAFDTVNLPSLGVRVGWMRVQYTPNAVRLRIPVCPADWNAFDGVNSQDFFDFVEDFFEGRSDFNRDLATNSQDFFDFVNEFFQSCA